LTELANSSFKSPEAAIKPKQTVQQRERQVQHSLENKKEGLAKFSSQYEAFFNS
jgi:hypothetical protein